jgi:hypothetical protein
MRKSRKHKSKQSEEGPTASSMLTFFSVALPIPMIYIFKLSFYNVSHNISHNISQFPKSINQHFINAVLLMKTSFVHIL